MENPNTVGIDVSGDFKSVLNRLAKLKTTDYIEYKGGNTLIVLVITW